MKHVVDATQHLVHAHARPAAAALLGVQARAIACAAANHRHRCLGQRGEDEFALFVIRQRLAAVGIDDLGQAVNVERLHAEFGFDTVGK